MHDSKSYFTSVVYHISFQFRTGTNPHSEMSRRSLYRTDIMSETSSSTVWFTPTATGRGLTVATMVGPVEAARVQDTGVRWHESGDVYNKFLRSKIVRLLVGVFRNPRDSHFVLIGRPSLQLAVCSEFLWPSLVLYSKCRFMFGRFSHAPHTSVH